MKVLILGAKGMLGADLVSAFRGHDVTAWDFDELDITEHEQVRRALDKLRPEVVVNAAALTDVDACQSKPEHANEVNGYAVGAIASVCKSIGAVLIYYSTDYIFDGQRKQGYAEHEVPDPINAYGQSKLLGERLIAHAMTDYYILRSSWLFGKNGKNFIRTMLELSRSQSKVQVVNDQHGKPTYTKDLAAGTLAIVEQKPRFGIYHIVNEDETTWFDFAVEIFDAAGKNVKAEPITSAELDRPAPRPLYSTLVNSRLPRLRSWREALRDYLKEIN